jgi:hypothetical protein
MIVAKKDVTQPSHFKIETRCLLRRETFCSMFADLLSLYIFWQMPHLVNMRQVLEKP